jgi:ribosomal-protein-alanine N-acetyltransferase
VGFYRIWAYHAKGNPASGRVMQKCGMSYVKSIPEGAHSNGGVDDEVIYEILFPENR